MLRKVSCVAAGIALACATGYPLSLLGQTAERTDLDMHGVQRSVKQDRLPVTAALRDSAVTVDHVPSQSLSIAVRVVAKPIVEAAVHTPRSRAIRTISVSPVREVPNEEAKRDRLPVGCDPAFSPVTTPALAHIGVRCDS